MFTTTGFIVECAKRNRTVKGCINPDCKSSKHNAYCGDKFCGACGKPVAEKTIEEIVGAYYMFPTYGDDKSPVKVQYESVGGEYGAGHKFYVYAKSSAWEKNRDKGSKIFPMPIDRTDIKATEELEKWITSKGWKFEKTQLVIVEMEGGD